MPDTTSLYSLYHYEGPVLRFGKTIANVYSTETRAKSKKAALNNIRFRIAASMGLQATTTITLPGKLTIITEV